MHNRKSSAIEDRPVRLHDDAPDETPDNRREERVITLYRASALETGSRQGLCVIKNLSTGGAMVRTTVELSRNEPIVLIMASGIRITGRVAWCQERLAGIAFDTPTLLSAVLDRGGPPSARNARRQPRLSIAIAARVTDGTGTKLATTCDISTHGARITCLEQVKTGSIQIELPRMPPISARVLWNIESQIGCIFDRPLNLDDLTAWIGAVE